MCAPFGQSFPRAPVASTLDVPIPGLSMRKTAKHTMRPEDFRVNGTWLAFRVNQFPIQAEGAARDIFVLQDAASMFIFGTALARPDAQAPSQSDVNELLQRAWARREEWPEELVVPGRPSGENGFVRAAAAVGVALRAVPEARLSFYIKDAQSAFEEFFRREQE